MLHGVEMKVELFLKVFRKVFELNDHKYFQRTSKINESRKKFHSFIDLLIHSSNQRDN